MKSDLLAMEISRQLGEDFEVPDYFTGGRYFVDEKTGELCSVGPDKLPGTADDIRLGKDW